MEQIGNLQITAINVNSFNMSTVHNSNAKCHLKVEGITRKLSDVILMSDCRLKSNKKKLEELLKLTRNGSYKLYANSTKESRGVAIAVRSTVAHEIITEYADRINENYLIYRMKIRGVEIGLGVIYGPNGNNREFYREIRDICNNLMDSNIEIILGGDFNTVLDGDLTINNRDLINRVGSIPNSQNSKVIRDWIAEGRIVDPYRFIHPDSREISYIPFRQRVVHQNINNVEVLGAHYSKARLDFMLISVGLLDKVNVIKYEDRLGRDFDHKEVLLKFGRGEKVVTTNIKGSTLKSEGAKLIGLLSFYEMLNEHLVEPEPEIGMKIGRIEAAIKRKEEYLDRQIDNIEARIADVDEEVRTLVETLPSNNDMLNRPSTCNNRMKFEMVTMGIKNRLLSLQANIRRKEISTRLGLVQGRNLAESEYGINSEEFIIASDALLTLTHAAIAGVLLHAAGIHILVLTEKTE